MLKRTAMIALAAVATIGLTGLSFTDADAKGGKGIHGNHHHGHHHHRHRHVKIHWHRRHIHLVRPVTTTMLKPTCTCLTKTYTSTGAVLFKDVCTNEIAMNPPETEQAAK